MTVALGRGDARGAGARHDAQVGRARWIALLAAVSAGCASTKGAPPAPVVEPFSAIEVLAGERTTSGRYRHFGVNPTIETSVEPRAVLAIGADSASSGLVAELLAAGRMPPEAAVRVEELIHGLDAGSEAPVEAPLALDVQVFPSPNRRGFHLLSLAVEARLPRGPAALRVFAVDLRSADEAIARCARAIRSWRGADRVALVTVGPRPALAVPPATPGGAALDAALAALVSTSGGALLDGLRVAFEAAAEIEGDRREVVLCAPQRPEDLLAATRLASRYAALGIRLHLIAAGPRYDPDALGALAEAGRGSLRYLDPRGDLELTTEPVADGLKLEVRFDPRFVARYRRIGWDGRRLGEVDLDDQRRPGGRLFGGQSARVLYEVELAGSWSSAAIAEVQLRGEPGVDLARPILGERIAPRWEAADPRHRLAALAGLFGEKLRGAYWARNLGYRDLADRLAALDLPAARSLEVLVAQAERIDRRGDRFEADRPIGEMTFQEVPVLGPPAPGGP